MKFTLKFAAVLSTAVLFSCGGNTTQTNPVDSTSDPSNSSTSAEIDTASIEKGQSVDFAELTNNQEVTSPFTVHFKVTGMDVEPIDSGVRRNKGHFHLLIDTMSFIPAGIMVPMGHPNIMHFGKGQPESEPLNLPKGPHKLSIQFGDGIHTSYGVRMSKTITVNVK